MLTLFRFGILIAQFALRQLERKRIMAAVDFTKANAALTTLDNDSYKLIAAYQADVQTAQTGVDALTTEIGAIDAKVVAALPAQ